MEESAGSPRTARVVAVVARHPERTCPNSRTPIVVDFAISITNLQMAPY